MLADNHVVLMATFAVYLLVMIVIGWIAYRQTQNMNDYVLGGRRLGKWTTALSAGASDMSAWLLLGLPGYAYIAGLESLWLALGLLLGAYINWRLLARRLRVYSELGGGAVTIPAYLQQRFNDSRGVLRLISALVILVFFFFYTCSGLVAGGKLFSTVFDMPYEWAVVAGASAIVLYTFMGGFLAVSWTDVIQALLMAAALVVVPLMAFYALGGGAGVILLVEQQPNLLNPLTDSQGVNLTFIAIVSLMGWGLGYFGQPHILARFKAVRAPEQLVAARRIAISWTALTLLGAILVGLSALVYLETPLASADSEKVFMVMVEALFHPVVAGILLAAILAAIMSTADSQLLVSSSALSEDLYSCLKGASLNEEHAVWLGRFAVVFIAVGACVLALNPENKVLDLVAYAWAGLGAAFGPVLILSLYWSRMNWQGALAGMVTGGLVVVIWKQMQGGIFDLYELVPGFFLALIAVVAVSKITPAPDVQLVAKHRRIMMWMHAHH